MSSDIQYIQQILSGIRELSDADKNAILAVLKKIGKASTLTEFKLSRLEKEKKTLTILLEETIEELEKKRKAVEAQNRELEIEAALERVRAAAMAMHQSDDLHAAVTIMFEEFQKLNLDVLRCGVGILNKESRTGAVWATSVSDNGLAVQISANESFDTHRLMRLIYEHWQKQEDLTYVLQGQDLIEYYKAMDESELKLPKSQLVFSEDQLKPQYYYCAMFNAGGLYAFRETEFTEDDIKIMKRFAGVLNLTYNRFSDLQRAEAQAREAKIEVALERVRARTMAMHKSDELSETAAVLFQQFKELGEDPLQITIGTINEAEGTMEMRITDWGDSGSQVNRGFILSIQEPALISKQFKAWKEHRSSVVIDLTGKELENWINYRNKIYGIPVRPKDIHGRRVVSCAFFSRGMLSISTPQPLPQETINLLERFAGVFDLTYTRFLDLQKAEAQAREAQIEAALERVRAKAMAMHTSSDLTEAAGELFAQLNKLDINPIRAGFVLLTKDSRKAKLYSATSFDNTKTVSFTGEFEFVGHPVFEKQYESWQKLQNYFPVLQGQNLKSYYKILAEGLSVPYENFSTDKTQYGSFLPFSQGFLFTWSEQPYSEKEIAVLERFKAILDLTIRRFLDLQKAEAQAREAQIEAALERVRARAMSMQNSDELKQLIGVVFTELTKLDILLLGSVIIIFDPDTLSSRWWMVNSEAPFEAGTRSFIKYHEHPPYLEFLQAWKERRPYWEYVLEGNVKKEWDEFLFSETDLALIPVPVIEAMRTPERILLSSSFNNFGCLNVGTLEPLTSEQSDILLRFAKVFDLTYTRFNDLKIAEAHALQAEQDLLKIKAARKKAEEALAELKDTQAQLIQREKMASLGELTAGIAHEIQNPLNFVNNFSEVNKELLAEMAEEIEKGNYDAAKMLAKHVEDNQEKINHHGKRADAIVKGMLHHSRSSSGIKEPTNINALADEYLRLAYHGLRAKDKSFNATLKTDFDESIGNINIISQDIGRVILNLITNAFYAVTEKKKQQPHNLPAGQAGYEPTVSLVIKKAGDKVLISVKDNGNGIPQKILDKIFLPFFTTKPAGQGTGLGLSLSYDIIKAHGGELKVETKEGESAEFIILLPFTQEILHIT